MTPTPPLLEVRKIGKRFPGVRALHDVDLTLNAGEVLALIGENGAGKSTLMKILGGVQSPSCGEIRLDGHRVSIDSVKDATRLRIGLIHQELSLSGNLTVGANIFLGHEPRRFGLIDESVIYNEARTALARIGLDLDPRTVVDTLSIGRQQMVEIARALAVDARILIMDEPSSSLSARETQQLLSVVSDLRARGVSIIYASHRLREVGEIADRVIVLRDGENAGELARDEIEHDAMVRLMVGRDLSQFYHHEARRPGETVFEVTGLRTPANPQHELSFSLRAGEIVAIAGLVGAGRTELLRSLFGVDALLGGTVKVAGRPVEFSSPRDAIDAGIALVPEDRKLHGLIVDESVRANIGLAGLRRHARRGGLLNSARERVDADQMIARLAIRTPGPEQITRYLSGGNQQKVVLGKWLTLAPRVLLMDEPTRGVDVGAKEEIYRLMEELAGQGVAILFVSSEMEEVVGMADRVLVMHDGRISGALDGSQLDEEAILRLATGKAS